MFVRLRWLSARFGLVGVCEWVRHDGVGGDRREYNDLFRLGVPGAEVKPA